MSANPIEILNTSEWYRRANRADILRDELRAIQAEQREIIEVSLRAALATLRWGFDADGVRPLDQPAINYCAALAQKCFEQEIYRVDLLGSDVILSWFVMNLGAQGDLELYYRLAAERPDRFMRDVEALRPRAVFEQVKECLRAADPFALQVKDARVNIMCDLAQAVRGSL